MPRRRIWIVSELFYPDEASTGYIMTSIAKALSAHPVHVICGPKGYDNLTAKADDEMPFTIHRIQAVNLDKNSITKRLVRLVILSLSMFLKGLFLIRRTDTVFIVTNPAFIVPFYAFISKVKGNKLYILVHDVFPENLIPARIVKSDRSLVYRLTKRIFKWSYSQADKLIVLGADMYEVMSNKVPNTSISIIENWADIEEIQPEGYRSNPIIKRFQLEDKIVFTFAGNIGRVQGLEFLVKIIKRISNTKVHFLFIGGGALLDPLKKELKNAGITCVTFAGNMPRNLQNEFLNAAHFGLVTLSSKLYGLGVPSKSYNIMAAGKPIFFIGNKHTEIAKMVIENDCGYVFNEEEETSLIRFFNELEFSNLTEAKEKGLRARRLAEDRYSEYYILEKFKDILLK